MTMWHHAYLGVDITNGCDISFFPIYIHNMIAFQAPNSTQPLC